MPDFYLSSTELREPFEPRTCRFVARLRSEVRDDLALVEVDPPLPRNVYDTSEDVRFLVLAARHQGCTLFPATEWPTAVYVCKLKGGDRPAGDAIESGDLTIVDWGEVRPVGG